MKNILNIDILDLIILKNIICDYFHILNIFDILYNKYKSVFYIFYNKKKIFFDILNQNYNLNLISLFFVICYCICNISEFLNLIYLIFVLVFLLLMNFYLRELISCFLNIHFFFLNLRFLCLLFLNYLLYLPIHYFFLCLYLLFSLKKDLLLIYDLFLLVLFLF